MISVRAKLCLRTQHVPVEAFNETALCQLRKMSTDQSELGPFMEMWELLWGQNTKELDTYKELRKAKTEVTDM